jgi:hypothetical protein
MGQGDATMYDPAWTWAHYKKATDTIDRDDRCFDNKAEQVKAELWVCLSRVHYSIHRNHWTFCNIDCISSSLYAGFL